MFKRKWFKSIIIASPIIIIIGYLFTLVHSLALYSRWFPFESCDSVFIIGYLGTSLYLGFSLLWSLFDENIYQRHLEEDGTSREKYKVGIYKSTIIMYPGYLLGLIAMTYLSVAFILVIIHLLLGIRFEVMSPEIRNSVYELCYLISFLIMSRTRVFPPFAVLNNQKFPDKYRWLAKNALQNVGTPEAFTCPSFLASGRRKMNIAHSSCQLTLSGHTGAINALAVSPDGLWIVSASEDGTLREWSLEDGRQLLILRRGGSGLTGVAFNLNGSCIISGGRDQRICIWNALDGQEISSFEVGTGVQTMAVRPYGDRVLLSGIMGLSLWDTVDGMMIKNLSHDEYYLTLLASADGKRFFGCHHCSGINIWDAESGEELGYIRTGEVGRMVTIEALAEMPDGRCLISVDTRGNLNRWDWQSGRKLGNFQTVEFTRAVAVAPDGQHIVTGGLDQEISIWDAQTGKRLALLSGHQGPVLAVALTPDGERIVSAGKDGTIRVWG